MGRERAHVDRDVGGLEGNVLEQHLLGQFVPPPASLMRHEASDRVGFVEETNLGAGDWKMWLRIAEVYYIADQSNHCRREGELRNG